jgi:hypothetical protein
MDLTPAETQTILDMRRIAKLDSGHLETIPMLASILLERLEKDHKASAPALRLVFSKGAA